MLRKLALVLAAWTALVASAGSARAQTAFSSGTVAAEGPGVKLGDSLVLHPGFAVIFGHDSNIKYSSSADPNVYAPYLALRPVIDLTTMSLMRAGGDPKAYENRILDFRLHLGSTMRFLLTGDQQFNRDHISIDVDGSAMLTLYPAGAVSFDVFDNFTRTSVPPYLRVDQPGNINFINNTAGLRLKWRPGGRRLEASLMYQFGVFAFEGDAISSRWGNKNYFSNDFQLRVSWKFFPKTAIYLQAQETIYSYYLRNVATPPNNYPLRIVLGLVGLITPTLTLNVNAGYGNGFYSTEMDCETNADQPKCASPQTAVVAFDLQWKPLPATQLALGYRHDFNVSLIGNYFDLDTIYVGASQQVWRLIGNLRFAWEERRFQGNLELDNIRNGRVDDLITFHVDINYPIRPWLVISLGDDVQINLSNCAFSFGGMVTSVACDYKRNDVWLKAAVAY